MVNVNFQCDLIPLYFFFILILMNAKIQLIVHTKFQPNTPSHFGEKVDLNVFSIGGHLELSTTLTFTGLKPCILLMLYVKFEIHGCSGFKEKVTDGPTDEKPAAYVAPC